MPAVTDAILVNGMKLSMSTDGTSYALLVGLKEIGVPGDPIAPDIDVTGVDPAIASTRNHKPGLINNGEFTFKQYLNKARLTLLKARMRLDTYFKVQYADVAASPAVRSNMIIYGYVKRVTPSPGGNPDDPQTIDVTVKVNDVTWAEGS